MNKKGEGDKSSSYRGGYHGKNAPAQGFQSNVAEVKDAIFTINPNQADAAKFEKTTEAISNYVVQNYDSGILLANGTREGKLPVVDLPTAPSGTKRKKKRRMKKNKKKKKKEEKEAESKGERGTGSKIGDHHGDCSCGIRTNWPGRIR